MNTVMTCVLVALGGGLLLAVTFGPLYLLLRDIKSYPALYWIGAWTWALLGIGIGVGAVVLYVNAHPDRSADHCADVGGVWTRVGQHRQMVGKVVETVGDYACVGGES